MHQGELETSYYLDTLRPKRAGGMRFNDGQIDIFVQKRKRQIIKYDGEWDRKIWTGYGVMLAAILNGMIVEARIR
jgi:hypothetical protein